ncbi:MAG: zincin-like metallopeptidase domain-containing protein [Pseudomonadota bacterium]|nr:zincin-like metallopeptidase domain-containing protein [Pseudomonadota bacterium]
MSVMRRHKSSLQLRGQISVKAGRGVLRGRRGLYFDAAFRRLQGADCFYAASFHELGHWTSHKSRLDRDLKNRFGSREYAAEELIAEFASAFLCAEFGINKEVRHASYIANLSAFIVSHKHINALVSAMLDGQRDNAEEVGRILLEENVPLRHVSL